MENALNILLLLLLLSIKSISLNDQSINQLINQSNQLASQQFALRFFPSVN